MTNKVGKPWHCLTTKPKDQAEQLHSHLQPLCSQLLNADVICIEQTNLSEQDKQTILDLDRFDWVIAVSPNAAKLGAEHCLDFWTDWPIHCQWACVGAATASMLEHYGLKPIFPSQGMNSEALLDLFASMNLHGKKFLIVKGLGGRRHLRSTLEQMGAVVYELNVYQRTPIPIQKDTCQKILDMQQPRCVIVTSSESWFALQQTQVNWHDNWWCITSSKRLAQVVSQHIDRRWISIAANATNQALRDAMVELSQ